MEHKKLIISTLVIIGIVILSFLLAGVFFKDNFINKKPDGEGFKINNVIFKISIEKDKTVKNNLKITNLRNSKEHFSLEIVNSKGLVSLSESEFDLEVNEEKSIDVIFNTKGAIEGVYAGELKVVSNKEERIIPIIIEIQSLKVSFDSNINIYPQGDIISGQKLNADIKIFDLLNTGRSNVKFSYGVTDFEGKNLVYESNDLVIDGRLDYSKTINLPSNLQKGSYLLFITINYKDSVGTSSILFNVVDQEEKQMDTQILIFWTIGIFSFFFLIFLALFFYSLIYRDSLLEELQNQYKTEIGRQGELIECKKKTDYSKFNGVELKEYLNEIERIKHQRINALNELHKKRIKEYERIKKKGNVDLLKDQINKWKKQGYDTSVLEGRYKLPSVNEIKSRLKKWKKQGYDTRVLRK